jgi:hypothetical protein
MALYTNGISPSIAPRARRASEKWASSAEDAIKEGAASGLSIVGKADQKWPTLLLLHLHIESSRRIRLTKSTEFSSGVRWKPRRPKLISHLQQLHSCHCVTGQVPGVSHSCPAHKWSKWSDGSMLKWCGGGVSLNLWEGTRTAQWVNETINSVEISWIGSKASDSRWISDN